LTLVCLLALFSTCCLFSHLVSCIYLGSGKDISMQLHTELFQI
jgi:hypothetical protein